MCCLVFLRVRQLKPIRPHSIQSIHKIKFMCKLFFFTKNGYLFIILSLIILGVFSGALEKKMNSKCSYREIVKESGNDGLATSKQIEKDLLRTMPSNVCFSSLNSTGIPRLRRVLRALAWLYPDIGYNY